MKNLVNLIISASSYRDHMNDHDFGPTSGVIILSSSPSIVIRIPDLVPFIWSICATKCEFRAAQLHLESAALHHNWILQLHRQGQFAPCTVIRSNHSNADKTATCKCFLWTLTTGAHM